MSPSEMECWLREADQARLEALWGCADAVRREHVGDDVHLRGLVEISSRCARQCLYCGLRAANRKLTRYSMSAEEVLACARQVVALGYGTIVLQAGEDPGMTQQWVSALVRRVKEETPLAVTLSLGERSRDELAAWRAAGADRYLLRFETSNAELFGRIHPPRLAGAPSRLDLLGWLRALGYEVGSGVMIGIPGQTYADLLADLLLFNSMKLDMIGVGPFLPHPETPLGMSCEMAAPAGEQAPNTELMTYKMIALARLVCPQANIPATTALATVNPSRGRMLGLQRGANVIMPNLTPGRYRAAYEVYPGKLCACEDPLTYDREVRRQIAALGRTVATGPGQSLSYRRRATPVLQERVAPRGV